MRMKKSQVAKTNTRLKAFWIAILVVALTPASTFAQKPSTSIGASCSKIGSLSGSVVKPLICKRVNGKGRWVLAPGGSCTNAGALAGTMKEPWVCQKVTGKLKWVVSVNSIAPSSSNPASSLTSIPQVINPQTSTTIKATNSPSGGGASSNTASTTTTTTTTTTTIPVVCPNSGNVIAEIISASDGSYRRIGTTSVTNFYTRNVQGVIRNTSGVSVSVLYLALSGNVMYGSRLEMSQTVNVGNNILLAAGGSYGWSKTYEALGHPDYSPQYGDISRNETIQSFRFVSTDARCP